MTDYRIFNVEKECEAALDAAAAAIEAGEVIVLPTDTVYGVGSDPFSRAAVQRLLDAKERGRDMPPPVLVAEVEMARSLIEGLDFRFLDLGRAFWPGALTLIGRAPASLRMELGDRGQTIAVRVPDDDFTRELLRSTGPLAVSSANKSGQDAALTIAEATEQLGDAISVYLDAGTMTGPVPSTIVDLTGPQARVLRLGRISVEQLNEVVPGLIPVEAAESTSADELTSGDAQAADTPADPSGDAVAPRHALASETDGEASDDEEPDEQTRPMRAIQD